MSYTTVSYRLDSFEGPLDLLLFLISKHKLNINDIKILLLLEQYLEYIDGIDEQDFEYAGEFLEMAARLILIKTLSLLPKHEEANEMKRELQGRLIEYSLCKQAAARLREGYKGDVIYVKKPSELKISKTYTNTHSPDDLIAAFFGISSQKLKKSPVQISAFRPIVSRRIVSVSSKIFYVLRRLYRTGKCGLTDLYDGMTDRSEKIATFLAILELTKSGRILLNDDNTEITFDPQKRRRRKSEE